MRSKSYKDFDKVVSLSPTCGRQSDSVANIKTSYLVRVCMSALQIFHGVGSRKWLLKHFLSDTFKQIRQRIIIIVGTVKQKDIVLL